jgi:hypothetical protein
MFSRNVLERIKDMKKLNGIDKAFMLFGDGWHMDAQLRRVYDECQGDRTKYGTKLFFRGLIFGLFLSVVLILSTGCTKQMTCPTYTDVPQYREYDCSKLY